MRRTANAADLTLLAAGAILAVAAGIAGAILSPASTAPAVDGSSYASHPRGAKAAYLVLRDLGFDVQRSFEPFATLDADAWSTIVVLVDPARLPSDRDLQAVASFVEEGGLLLAAGAGAAAFLPDATAHRSPNHGPRVGRASYRPAAPSPLTREVETLRMSPAGGSVAVNASLWVPIFGTASDPAVLMARRGAGRILWITSAEPLSNGDIAEPGHLELLLNIVSGQPSRLILWDEHYHGHTRSLWSYARDTPVAWGLVQLGIVCAAVLFTSGRRVGPARSRPADPRTSPTEFIETVGGLYQRAHAAAAAVEVARARARRLLQARSGLPPTASDDRIAEAAERFGLDPEKVRSLLTGSAAAARDPRLEDDAAVRLVGRLQRMVSDAAPASYRGGGV